jgi:hypothetical protein
VLRLRAPSRPRSIQYLDSALGADDADVGEASMRVLVVEDDKGGPPSRSDESSSLGVPSLFIMV